MTTMLRTTDTAHRHALADVLDGVGTVLGVWAHPDDETYLSGGLMAALADAGRTVALVTATYGERGAPPGTDDLEAVAALRRAELRTALDTLGVVHQTWIGFPDGGCAAADNEAAIGALVTMLRLVRPDTVLTFPPDGLTGHPDHMAVSRWTTEAFRRAAPAGARLWYAATTPERYDEFAAVEAQLEVHLAGTPALTERDALALQLELPDDLLDCKVAALAAHHSQTAPLFEAMGPELFRAWVRTEEFVAAA